MHPTNERKRLVGVTETIQRYTDGSITYSKPKENKMKGGWSLYPRDSHNGNILPRWLLPWLPTPFTPAISKFKTDANAFTNADMELSVRDTPDGRLIVAMCTAIDASIRAEVVSRRDELQFRKTMSAGDLAAKHRPSLTPNSKTGGFPYLLRVKCHGQKTKFYRVTGDVSADGKTVCAPSTLDDIVPFTEVLPGIEHTGIYVSPQSFGATFFAFKVMTRASQRRTQADAEADDGVDDMGDDFVKLACDPLVATTGGTGGNDSGGGGNADVDGDEAARNTKRMRLRDDDNTNDGNSVGQHVEPHDTAYDNSEEDDS